MTGECPLCGYWGSLENHHIFGGAYRKKSDKYGLTIGLCHCCHNEPPLGVHHNAGEMLKLKQYGQRKAMAELQWDTERFIKEFGKNYL